MKPYEERAHEEVKKVLEKICKTCTIGEQVLVRIEEELGYVGPISVTFSCNGGFYVIMRGPKGLTLSVEA